jgi:hypothetical protein
MPVHVRAGPGAERQDRRLDPGGEGALDLFEHLGHRVEQRRLEHEQVAAHLVVHARARAPDLVRLPPDRDDLLDLLEHRAAPRAAGARVVEPVQQVHQIGLVVEH